MNQKKQKKSSAPAIIVILLICGGAAALFFTGKLQPVIDKIRGKKDVVEQPVVKPVEKPTGPKIEEPVTPETPAEPKVEEPVTPEKPAESEQAAKYRARFRTPKIGQEIKVYVKDSKTPRTGALTRLDDSGISVKTEKYEMSLTKAQLSQLTLAQCYEDDFVKYMIARDAYIEQMEKKRAEQLARMKADYLASLKKAGKPLSASSGTSASTGSNVSIDDVDFKKWMEENGASDLLKERQERIKQYESQRTASGL